MKANQMNLEKSFNDVEEMVENYVNLKSYQVILFLVNQLLI